jgi:2-oxoglutarate ferredoxin oxidoreductase subunit beta
VKEHDAPLHSIDFVPHFEDIHVDYEPGTTHEVEMPDGSRVYLKKLGADYDPRSREAAIQALEAARREQRLLTGLLYVEPEQMPFEEDLKLVEGPLAALPLEKVRPPKSVLDEIMGQYMTGKGLSAPAGGG